MEKQLVWLMHSRVSSGVSLEVRTYSVDSGIVGLYLQYSSVYSTL